MASNRAALISLLVIGTSLRATDHDVSIASVAVGAKPWQWTVFLKGTPDALAHVSCVQYVLDPSFPNPHRTVCERGVPDRPFATSGVTWGRFNLSATVTFDDKKVQQLQYTLNPPAPVGSFTVEPGLRCPGCATREAKLWAWFRHPAQRVSYEAFRAEYRPTTGHTEWSHSIVLLAPDRLPSGVSRRRHAGVRRSRQGRAALLPSARANTGKAWLGTRARRCS